MRGVTRIQLCINLTAVDLHDGDQRRARHRKTAYLRLTLCHGGVEGCTNARPPERQLGDLNGNQLTAAVRFQNGEIRLASNQFVIGNEIPGEQFLGFGQSPFRFYDLRIKRNEPGLRLRQCKPGIVVIQLYQELTFSDLRADIRRHLIDQCRHFRGNDGAIRRHDGCGCAQLPIDQQVAKALHGDRSGPGHGNAPRYHQQ